MFNFECKLERSTPMLYIDLRRNLRQNFLVSAGLLGVFLLVQLSSVAATASWNFHSVFFPIYFLLCSVLATSSSFNELNRKEDAASYLGLPASALEKLSSKITVSLFINPLAVILKYFLGTSLIYLLSMLLFGKSFPLFNPFEANYAV